jgi:hypothetical protein
VKPNRFLPVKREIPANTIIRTPMHPESQPIRFKVFIVEDFKFVLLDYYYPKIIINKVKVNRLGGGDMSCINITQ